MLCYINSFINLHVSIHDINGHVFSVYYKQLHDEVRNVDLKKVSDVNHIAIFVIKHYSIYLP